MIKCPRCEYGYIRTDGSCNKCNYHIDEVPAAQARSCRSCRRPIGDGHYYRAFLNKIDKTSVTFKCGSCLHPDEWDWRDKLVMSHLREDLALGASDRIEIAERHLKHMRDNWKKAGVKLPYDKTVPLAPAGRHNYDEQALLDSIKVPF